MATSYLYSSRMLSRLLSRFSPFWLIKLSTAA